MNHRARCKLLKFLGIFMMVLFPVVLAIWSAHIRAMTETHNQLRSFAQLVLNKTELVILRADLARDMAQLYRGKVCALAHQKSILNIIRDRLYISGLIYAQSDHFLCSTSVAPPVTYIMPTVDYKRTPDISIYYYRDTPFFAGYRTAYIQRGNYVAAINPLSYSEVMSDDPDLPQGVYDTVTDTSFSASGAANIAQFAPLIRDEASIFQQDDRFYTIVHSEKRPIAIIVSTSDNHVSQTFYHGAALTIPFGIICSILILLMWWHTRQEYLSPRHSLECAIKKRQLCLHYQPIIDIKNGQCVSAETLLHWPGCKGEIMSPTEFIPPIEKEGMIERITDYVVKEVFNDLGYFLSAHPQLSILINLSISDFHSSRLIALINDKDREYSVAAQQIKVEMTERGFIDVRKMTPVIQVFRKAGYEVAPNDFGTEYSNLHNLSALNADVLKIDKSFISTLSTNGTSHLTAGHIIEMAQSLYLKTIAGGVETKEQIEWLLGCGVQYCQGWYFVKALSPQESTHWIQRSPVILMQSGQ